MGYTGKNDKVIRTNESDPYKLTNDDLIYGFNGKSSTGLYQHSVNKTMGYKDVVGSNSLSKKAINAAKKDGLTIGTAAELRSRAFTKFSKFGYLDPYGRMPGATKEVLFFTKPDLHLVHHDNITKLTKGLSNAPFFMELHDKYPHIIKELQYNCPGGNESQFMCSLHNRVRDTLELPDISSNDIDLPTNMYGNDYTYRGSSESSDDQYTFSLEFEDNKYLDIYMLFRAYEEYERYKRLGLVAPLHRHISRKELHDQINIFKFTLSEDFSTIIHYAELWGCYPTGLPRSAFNSTDFSSSGLTLSIPWKCAFVEDMNPLIITDFNYAMRDYEKAKKIENVMSNGRINKYEWADGAYIVQQRAMPDDPNSRYVYKLEWRKK